MYRKEQSIDEALAEIGNQAQTYKDFQPANSPTLASVGLGIKYAPLRTYHTLQIWRGKTIKNGQVLLKELDDLFDELLKCNNSFYNRMQPIEIILVKHKELKDSMIAYQEDVETYLLIHSITAHSTKDSITHVTNTLLDVKNRYKDIYEHAYFKLNSISNGRVTASIIMMSFVAIVISIIALL